MRLRVMALLGLVLLFAAMSCGREREVSTTTATTVPRLPSDTITFRPVMQPCEGPEPCPSPYELGPVLVDASSLESARVADVQGPWVVQPIFREGTAGIDRFNAAAAMCFAQSAQCPTGQLAMVVDGEVISAPNINEPSFERDQIQISGDYTEQSATELANRLNAAAG